jgi:hypothetical protein
MSLLSKMNAELEDKQPENRQSKEPIAELIKLLGSEDYTKREDTTRRLLKREADAVPGLEKASRSDDPEVRGRAADILAVFAKRKEARKLSQMLKDLNGQGYGLDSFLDRMVEEKGYATKDRWADVLHFSRLVTAKAKKIRPDGIHLPESDALDYPFVATNTLTREGTGDKRRIVGSNFRSKIPICESVLLSTGAIHIQAPVFGSILFAGQDITINGPVMDSLLIASGNVKLTAPAVNSVILSGDKITNTTRVVNFTEEWEEVPDKLFVFFNSRMLGIQVSLEKDGLRVVSVTTGSPFAKSRVRAGDVLVFIDGMRMETINDVRIALRKSLLRNKAMLTLRCDGKQREIKVSYGLDKK